MRGYTPYNVNPTIGEKTLCALFYFTFISLGGLLGFIYIIFIYVTRRQPKSIVKFHAIQSIFLSVIFYLLNIIFGILIGVVKIIPIIDKFLLGIISLITEKAIIFGYPLLSLAIIFMLGYLIYVSLKGEMGNIPWVSDNVRRMI